MGMTRRAWWLAVGAVAAGSVVFGQESTEPAKAEPPAREVRTPAWPEHVSKELYAQDVRGKKAPEFVVEEVLTEKPDREGKVILVDFWATWCGPCRKLIPELNDLQKEFRNDLVVIGISDEPAEKVREFMKKTEMKYAQAVDTQGRMKKEIKVRGIPHVLIISTDGVVRWQGYPLSADERLTSRTVRRIIEADPGVKARREAEAKKGKG